MLTILSVLRAKGSEVYSVESGTSILKALQLMAEKGIGALPVMEKEEPVGIFSERDFARMAAMEKNLSLETPVDACMTREIFSIKKDESIDEVMALMTAKHIRHLPVTENGKIVGIISIGDVVKNLIEDKDLLIKNMEDFIQGSGFGK